MTSVTLASSSGSVLYLKPRVRCGCRPCSRDTRWQLCGHREDAEDVAQSSLVKAAEHIAAFRGEATVRTWLHRITTNECRMLRVSGGLAAAERQPAEQYSIAASARSAHRAAWGAGTTTHSFIGRPPIGSNRCAPGIPRA